MCDKCPRVVCTSHINLPVGCDIRSACFICIACHIRAMPKASPYFVSFLLNKITNMLNFMPGLLSWPCLCPSRATRFVGAGTLWAVVCSRRIPTYSTIPRQKWLYSPPPFHPQQYFACWQPCGSNERDAEGFPSRRYLPVSGDSIWYVGWALPRFTRCHLAEADAWNTEVHWRWLYFLTCGLNLAVSVNFQRVIVFITNHSHNDSGDMYLGPNICAPTDYVSIYFCLEQYFY